ncbi:MAG: hypothetical protein EAY65_04730 [Alphaproteobacteria bacterium]|nr:MAG: hypothetical protein EAY65_04730 [Alphaproteobacteria bacterium]
MKEQKDTHHAIDPVQTTLASAGAGGLAGIGTYLGGTHIARLAGAVLVEPQPMITHDIKQVQKGLGAVQENIETILVACARNSDLQCVEGFVNAWKDKLSDTIENSSQHKGWFQKIFDKSPSLQENTKNLAANKGLWEWLSKYIDPKDARSLEDIFKKCAKGDASITKEAALEQVRKIFNEAKVNVEGVVHGLEPLQAQAKEAQGELEALQAQMEKVKEHIPKTVEKLDPAAKNCVIVASCVAAVGAAAWVVNRAYQHGKQQQNDAHSPQPQEQREKMSHLERLEAQRAIPQSLSLAT